MPAPSWLGYVLSNGCGRVLEINKGLSQRIILIAANFRREVTSTVLWLLNYRVRLQCFKVTPYTMGEQLLLNFEQIIPMLYQNISPSKYN